ncbi:hypothetical protein M407DRAFT_35124 [Tulasnella calospora MUT 4182]|uniref:Uncharacterized protein n=1 Tax=Tulasnella calospora MUT 4182 TaxID=1051891 RepID=A0A0C3PZL0_9AGAM|nr:hypothetical protein M407DRAFT_35124 [Tulasnella calospora MUT 4182]
MNFGTEKPLGGGFLRNIRSEAPSPNPTSRRSRINTATTRIDNYPLSAGLLLCLQHLGLCTAPMASDSNAAVMFAAVYQFQGIPYPLHYWSLYE